MSDGKVSLEIEVEQRSFLDSLTNVFKGAGNKLKDTIRSSFEQSMKGMKNTKTPIIKAPKVEPINTTETKVQIEQLTAVLDNTNAKIDLQQRKLAELKESYETTFSDTKKSQLEEKIVNTEAAILRLTKSSDTTSQKLWKLEDSLENAGKTTQEATKPVAKLNTGLEKTSKVLKSTQKDLNKVGRETKRTTGLFAIAGKGAGKMTNQFTQGFSRIAKQVLVFAVLYKAIRGFQSYMSESLKTNDQYVRSLETIRTNLKTAFQPIFEAALPAINALMNALVRITAYIAAFTSALFGKTYKQSKQAAKGMDEARKAVEGFGKAGKKAAGQLAGFDELNVLDQSLDDGAGGLDLPTPDMNIDVIQSKMDKLADDIRSQFDRVFSFVRNGWAGAVETFRPSFQTAWLNMQPTIDGFKQSFQRVFDDVQSLGDPFKTWWQSDFVPFLQSGIEDAGKIWGGLLDSVRGIMDSLWDAAFPILDKFVTDGLPRITEFVNGAKSVFLDLFDTVKTIFDDIWRDAVDPALKVISNIIQDALDIIFEWWDTWGKDILKNLRTSLDGIKSLWNNLWQKFLKPLVTTLVNTVKKLWDDHLKDMLKELGKFIGKLITGAQDILNKFIIPVVNWLVQKLGPVFAEVFSGVMKVIGTAVGAVIDAATGIIKALGGIIDFIVGVFTGDWKRAWEGIKTFMSGIGEAITAIFKGAINSIIDAFNWMIRQLNKFKVDIPDWVPLVGGSKFGISIPEIPKLAKGGLVSAPTLAMVGDNPGANVDPEVVSPLSKLQEMLNNEEVVQVLMMILSVLEKIEQKDPTINVDGTELGKVTTQKQNTNNRRTGKTLQFT